MAVRKICRQKGCRASPRCEHPWWFDIMHGGKRWRMRVDDFALARGATEPVASKQAAEHVWEPKFLAEIVSGRDPRVMPDQKRRSGAIRTIADLLDLYRARYLDIEPLKSRASALSQLRILSAELGRLPLTALERPDAIEDFKKRCAGVH